MEFAIENTQRTNTLQVQIAVKMLSFLAPSIEIFILIFVAVDPLGLIPVFASLTSGQGMSKKDLKFVYVRATIIALGILMVFWFFGGAILATLGIGMSSFRIVGGLFLMAIAHQLLFGNLQEQRERNMNAAIDDEFLSSLATFPLATPMIAGPAAITLTIFFADGAGPTLVSQIISFTPVAAVVAVAGICMWISSELASKVSGNILVIHQKLFGLLLGAIAIEFIIFGLKGTFSILA